jgi:hypothetical protein
VLPGQTTLIPLSVGGDVLGVAGTELLQGVNDDGETPRLSHSLSREVGVAPRPVPVTGNGLGVQGDDHAERLADTLEDVTRDPHLVAGLNADGGADLVLPLAGEDLTVDTRDLDVGVQAGTVVRLGDVAAVGVLRPDGAVVGAWRREGREGGRKEGGMSD